MKVTVGLPAKQAFTLAGYSAADGWALTGKIAGPDGAYDLAAGLFTGVGTAWTLTIDVATTGAYAAGDRTLYLIATKEGEYEVVLEEPCSIVALGTVSHSQKMVTALRALMEGASAKDYISLSTPEGESITRLSPEDRIKWLRHYEKRFADEQRIARSGARVKRIQLGFG